MATLETYRGKFSESGWQIFERSVVEARRRGHNQLGVEHVLYALMEEKAEFFSSLLNSLLGNPEAVELLAEMVRERLGAVSVYEGRGLRLKAETIDLFKRTLKRIRQEGRQRIEATDIFFTMVMDEKGLLRELMRRLLADPRAQAKHWRDIIGLVESPSASGHRASGTPKYQYSVGERVRIKTGPFAAFTAQVEEVSEDRYTIRVRVSIMGRSQPVELRFMDVEKINFTE